MAPTNIKIERYKNPAGVDGWAGYIEPSDLAWILYFRDNGSTKFYPHRDRRTGAVIEPEAPVRRFVLWRHEDQTGISGTGLVAYGWEREDGLAIVRWLGEHRTETLHEGGMASVHAIHGHGGRTSIYMSDVDPDTIGLPAMALTGSGHDGVWLTRDPDHTLGYVVGLHTPCSTWMGHRADGPGWGDAPTVDRSKIVTGDLILGAVVDGEHAMFHETVGGSLLATRERDGVVMQTWSSPPNNPRRERALDWHEVVEIFARDPSHLLVSRLTGECGGDPALHRIPIGDG
jgi:hypothetical protein